MSKAANNDARTDADFEAMIVLGETEAIEKHLDRLLPGQKARAISWLSVDDKAKLVEMLGPETFAHILTEITGLGVNSIVRQLPPAMAAALVAELPQSHSLRLLRSLKDSEKENILEHILPHQAQRFHQALSFPENTAGALMITEFLVYPEKMIVRDVLDDMTEHGEVYSDYDIQYAYVVSIEGVLLGVLRLRDLLLAPKGKSISAVMIKDPLCVRDTATLQELRDFFREKTFLGVPVVDASDRLLGIVRGASVKDAITRTSNQMFLKFAGIVGGEEFRTMGLFKRSSRRLSWLSINIVLNIVAASVIAIYQDTLERAIVLAVFLPIISDMSGCSGNQAVAVSIRELTLGLVRPKELWRVLSKEATIGLINGAFLGLLLGSVAMLWKGNPYLGLVVGASLAANTLLAVSFGGLVPLLLKRMGTDPALASGPLLTTVTDMCGFFFVLSFATLMLPRLGG